MMKLLKLCFLSVLIISVQLFAQTSLVVVVHKDNTNDMLSKKEVIDIYMGRYVTFPDGVTAKPIDLQSNSAFKNEFYLNLVNKSERKIDSYWARLLFSGRAKPPESVNSVNEVVKQLENSKFIIAYMPESAVTKDIKVVYKFNEN